MDELGRDLILTIPLLAWVLLVSGPLTKRLYRIMVGKGVPSNAAIYFNRKIIHILSGGLVALLIPMLFSSPMMPLLVAMLLAIMLYIPHKTGRLLYWFQTEDNMFEVHFCVAWGLAITLGWALTNGDFRLGMIPVLYMSFGDSATGIVRNLLFRRRTKSWWGNLAMAAVCIPIGASIGPWGVLSAMVASLLEHFELDSIDDNITIPASSFTILYFTYPSWGS